MKILLTSFGLSHLKRKNENNDLFHRMPPVSISSVNQMFMPDYSVLLLAEKIILDNQTYYKLMTDYHYSYSYTAEMIRALYDEGFVQVENFDAVINKNKRLLETMLDRDLRELSIWIKPLEDSAAAWREFCKQIPATIREDLNKGELQDENITYEQITEDKDKQRQMRKIAHWLHDNASLYEYKYHNPLKSHWLLEEAIHSSTLREKPEHREALKKHLSEYLSYINANILLSQTFQAGFHDWVDFKPFYHEKFLRIAQDSYPAEKEIENVKKLFEISFPEFTFWQPKNVIKALKDKRITDLRKLIESASKGDVQFDKEFANKVLSEVFKIESNIGRFRNIISYATTPLGFIPTLGTPIQKVVEELVVQPVQNIKRNNFKWFYFISEMSRK